MTRWWVLPMLAAGFGAMPAWAGSLMVAPPIVESDEYFVPVMLTGGGDVAALDFRLRYDPAVFEPVATAIGPAAAAANKQVAANTAAPGEHIVVVMGLNQSVMQSGEVVNVLMRRVGTPESASTRLEIGELAMSSPDGVELPSQGSGRDIPMDGAPEPEEPGTANPRPGDDRPNRPGPGAGTAPPSGTPDAAPTTGAGAAWVWQPDGAEGEGDEGGGANGIEQAAPRGASPEEVALAQAALDALRSVNADTAPGVPETKTETGPQRAPMVPGERSAVAGDQGVPDAEVKDERVALAALPVESRVERGEAASAPAVPSGRAPLPMAALVGLVGLLLAVAALVALRGRLFR